MRQKKVEAIILGTTDVFDADRSFLLFSRELGKIRARAKGVRKPTSKLTGHLLPYLPTSLELLETGTNFLIIQAQVIRDYMHEVTYPADSLSFSKQAGIIAETLNRMYPEGEAHEEVYSGLLYTLDRLRFLCSEIGNTERAEFVCVEFLLKAVTVLGYTPELKNCVSSGNVVTKDFIAWDSQLGGVLSNQGWQDIGKVGIQIQDARSIVVLRQFLGEEFVAERLTIESEVRKEVLKIAYDYLQTQIGQPLKALT